MGGEDLNMKERQQSRVLSRELVGRTALLWAEGHGAIVVFWVWEPYAKAEGRLSMVLCASTSSVRAIGTMGTLTAAAAPAAASDRMVLRLRPFLTL